VKACPICSAAYGNDVGFCPRDGSALRSTAGLEPGSIIRKKYEIISEIGRGGMGVVYRARHLIWNEQKALKVLASEGAGAQQGLKGLLAEALVMRQLQHPHIVRVEDADYTEDDQPFVVMEYVDGQSLRQRLNNTLTLAPEFALKIAAQTCSALSAAHQKGIIHRDIKPQNLLLAQNADGSESVKVIDFGIAKVREDAGLGFTGIMTGTTGYFVCTPAYASPEQAQGMRGGDLDGRSDVYSLGLVLYEMLTGRLPFAADNTQALLVQRLQVEPMPLDRARPDLTFPPYVSGLVMKALERDRENRWRSADEMERAIATALDARRAEYERAETARLAAERRREETEKARMAAEDAKRERQERERVQAARAAAERAEQERRQREEAERTRQAAEREQARAEQQRLAREEAERRKQARAARQERRKGYGGTTRVRPYRKLQRVLLYGVVGTLPLAAIWFFVAHHAAENSARAVSRAPSAPGPHVPAAPPGPPPDQAARRVAEPPRTLEAIPPAKATVEHTITPSGKVRPAAPAPSSMSQPESTNAVPTQRPVESSRDQLAWETLDQSDPAVLQAFARQYPDSAHAPQALAQAEQLGVGQALALFTRAIGQKDEALLKEVWPTIPQAILDKWRATFQNARSVSIDLHPGRPQMAGASASVECRSKIQQVYPGDSQTYFNERTMRIALQKQGGYWKIVSVR